MSKVVHIIHRCILYPAVYDNALSLDEQDNVWDKLLIFLATNEH